MTRTILHVDLDAFYASVEQLDDPSLRGKPVIVGGSLRGVVLAASYEARPFGVKSAIPMARALPMCPNAIVVAPRHERYAELSDRFFAILGRYSPLVEGLSLDEAFLDVTGEEKLFGDGPTIGRTIKAAVRAELGLVASVGVAAVKFIAKIASDLGKPDGLVMCPSGAEQEFLAPLPISRLWGVGEKTGAEMARLGLGTIGDVARVGERALVSRLGEETGRHLHQLALGIDPRVVEPDREPVSIGHEDTFERDLADREILAHHLLDQADRTCARLRRLGLRARIVTIKVKYADHKRTSRRLTLPRPTTDARLVGETARRLLSSVEDIERKKVRLTGVSLSGLSPRDGARQLGFDEAEVERGERLGDALDKVAARFGRGAVKRAVLVDGEDDE
jgi:DNA polymerase IV